MSRYLLKVLAIGGIAGSLGLPIEGCRVVFRRSRRGKRIETRPKDRASATAAWI